MQKCIVLLLCYSLYKKKDICKIPLSVELYLPSEDVEFSFFEPQFLKFQTCSTCILYKELDTVMPWIKCSIQRKPYVSQQDFAYLPRFPGASG